MPDLHKKLNLDALRPIEQERASEAVAEFRLAVAVLYGDRIPDILNDDLEASFLNEPRVFRFLLTGERDEFDLAEKSTVKKIAKQTVQGHEFAARALALQDESKKEAYAQEFVSLLSPERRMAMWRAGTLDLAVERYVHSRIEEEVHQC